MTTELERGWEDGYDDYLSGAPWETAGQSRAYLVGWVTGWMQAARDAFELSEQLARLS